MLNTKDIKTTGGSSIPKTLQPGNQVVYLNKIELEDFKFKPGALHLILHCEGEKLEDGFEGFFIDKNDPSKGRYAGQVGKVKAGLYAFADGTTKSGIEVNRDADILRFLKNLCIELNVLDWLELQDGKHSTIQSLIEQFNADKPFAGVPLNACIAGKEYLNKEGYINFDLFLPKFSKAGVPFEGLNKAKSKLMKFNTNEHIIKKATENISSFDDGSEPTVHTKKNFEL